MRPLALFLWVPLLAAGRPQEETVFIDEIKKDYIDKIKRCEDARDWKGLFAHYAYALKSHGGKVVPWVGQDGRVDPDRWTSLGEFLVRRFSRLPPEAYAWVRAEQDIRGRSALSRAREAGDWAAVEKLIPEHFFSTAADDHLDALGNLRFEQGRIGEALFHWNRLLRYYPDSEIPRSVTAARLAHAYRMAGDAAGLRDLRAHLESRPIEGPVVVAGKQMTLSAFLADLHVPPRPAPPRRVRMPYAYGPADRALPPPPAFARNDVKRWAYDFSSDQAPGVAVQRDEQQRLHDAAAAGQVAPGGPFPFFPVYTEVRGKEYLILSNGERVVAVNPSRVNSKSPEQGIYWKFGSEEHRRIQQPSPGSGVWPQIGPAVEGEFAYAAMYSRGRPRDPNGNDPFEGVTGLRCFSIPTGRVVWDTDRTPLAGEYREALKDFFDRNFSYSAPPLVRGDRLFLGVGTSPLGGEQESRVLCVDRHTGKPLWHTFLASVAGANARNFFGGHGGGAGAQLTMIEESDGVIYAHTNLGIMAALSSATGQVLWLTRYKRQPLRQNRHTGEAAPSGRAHAGAPALWEGNVYVLPQDKEELLAFERATGRPVPVPELRVTGIAALTWTDCTRILGRVEDSLVLSGTKTTVVFNLKDFTCNSLAKGSTTRTGRGTLSGDHLYLPVLEDEKKAGLAPSMAVFDTQSWKMLGEFPWKGLHESGNLLVAGRHLVVSTFDRAMVYADIDTLRAEFARRIGQSPPHPPAFLEFAETMRANGQLTDAADAYLAFLRAAEGDPKHEALSRKVRVDLYGVLLEQGDKAADLRQALEFFRRAREFAYDDRTAAESTLRLADTHRKLENWSDAVAHYQELIERWPNELQKAGDQVTSLWDHASKQIGDILKQSADAYLLVERRAREALQKAQEGGQKALEEFRRRFPNSDAAKDALRKLFDDLFRQGRLERLPSLFDEMRESPRAELGFEASKRLLEVLEKIGDAARLRYELGRFGARFGDRPFDAEGGEMAREAVARRLAGLVPARFEEGPLPGALVKSGEMGKVQPPTAQQEVRRGILPLRPLGIAPPGMARHLQLFTEGSAVELWDLKERRRVWSRTRPGGWFGMSLTDVNGTFTVSGIQVGSPAAAAGLMNNDAVTHVGGEPVGARSLATARPEGAVVEIAYLRGGRPATARVELGAVPPGSRPAVVGASFTRDYGLAVAWEDGLASLDPATGRVRWTWQALREGHSLRLFHAVDGRLLLLEVRPPDPARGRRGEEGVLRLREQNRLICLNDATGLGVWTRTCEVELPESGVPGQASFHGAYLSDHFAFLQTHASSSGMMNWTLQVVGTREGDVSEPSRRVRSQLLSWAVDAEAGIFYGVDDSGDGTQRGLRSIAIDPARVSAGTMKAMDFRLTKHMPTGTYSCTLVPLPSGVCLLVAPPPQAAGEPRLWHFPAAGGEPQALKLRDGRTLPANRAPMAAADREGTLYVYNIPADSGSRAYLTAMRPEGAAAVAWDAIAPVLKPTGPACAVIQSGGRGLVLFSTPRAAAPGGKESAMSLVYDAKAGGRLVLEQSDLEVFQEGADLKWPGAGFAGDRLVFTSRQSVQLFGE